jgi:hypothetical protein
MRALTNSLRYKAKPGHYSAPPFYPLQKGIFEVNRRVRKDQNTVALPNAFAERRRGDLLATRIWQSI